MGSNNDWYIKKIIVVELFIFFSVLTFNNFYKITLGSYSSSNIEKVKSEISLLKSSIEILELENRILEVEISSFSDEDEAIIGLARSERGLIKKGEQLVEFK